MLPKLPKTSLNEVLRRMLRIRHFEESLVGLFDKGHFRGHYHLYIGQEATGVAAIHCLGEGDYLFTTHRNHGHLLARGLDAGRLLAEILGRRDGYNKGKGGSFHTSVASAGILQTSAVVAGILPLSIGVAYAAKAKKTDRVSLCLFGDGALEEGAAPESLNLASLWKLPVLFLCENNGKYGRGRAGGAARSSTMAVYPLIDLPKAYRIPAKQIDGTDAGAVHDAVSEAVAKIRRGEGAQFIEALTVRWPGNESNWPVVPVATDVAFAWDLSPVPEKVRQWYADSDPVLLFARELVEGKEATREEVRGIDREVRGEIGRAVDFALKSPYPDVAEALTDVFA